MSTVTERARRAQINGLTDPYINGPCARIFADNHTFRWVRGDRYIAVMAGTCIDARRVLVLEDHLQGHTVLEDPQPIIDAIPAPPDRWCDDGLLHRLAENWATRRGLRQASCEHCSRPA